MNYLIVTTVLLMLGTALLVQARDQVDGRTGDPSPVVVTNNGARFQPYVSGKLNFINLSFHTVESIIKRAGGSLDGRFSHTEDALISANECDKIKEYMEEALSKDIEAGKTTQSAGNDITADFRMELSPSELTSLISKESINKIHKAYKDHHRDIGISHIALRRAHMSGDTHIDFHQNRDLSVMNIFLNKDENRGGALIFLNRMGTVRVDTTAGSAVVQSNKMVHGVTPHTGTRYTLVLSGHHGDQDVLEELFPELVESEPRVEL